MIRLLIVTGYLGAGKTTLLKTLRAALGDAVECRFIVNEAGAIALDHAVYTTSAAETTVIAGGCACCVRRDALVAALRSTVEGIDRPESGWIVVETSGLANPAPIVFSILGDDLLKHHVAIAGVVAAIGAEQAKTALAQYPTVAQQLAMADAVIVTKTDRVDAATGARLVPMIVAHTARAAVFTAGSDAPLDWPALLAALDGRTRDRTTPPTTMTGPPGHDGHADIIPCVIPIGQSLDWQAFGVWLSALLAEHGENIVRVKGVIPVRDWHGQTFHVLINGVQHVVYPPEHITDPTRLPDKPALIFFLRDINPDTVVVSLHHFMQRFTATAHRTD